MIWVFRNSTFQNKPVFTCADGSYLVKPVVSKQTCDASFNAEFPWCYDVTSCKKIHKEDSLFLNASRSKRWRFMIIVQNSQTLMCSPGRKHTEVWCSQEAIWSWAWKQQQCHLFSWQIPLSSWEQIKHLIERASRSNWLPSVLSNSLF